MRREAKDINRPEIILSALHFDWETVEEACDRCLNNFGFDGIEFSYPHPRFGPRQLDEARTLSEKSGLRLNGHFWGNLASEDRADAATSLRRWLRTAVLAGFEQVIVHGGSCREHDQGIERVCEVIQQVIGEFEESGVILAVENHYPFAYNRRWELFSTPDEFTYLAGEVDSKALSFGIDYGHSRMNDCTGALLDAMAPRLVNVHISDNMGTDDDHLPFGEGVIEWNSVLRKTRQVGFEGPFTIEFPVEEKEECLGNCIETIQRFYDE